MDGDPNHWSLNPPKCNDYHNKPTKCWSKLGCKYRKKSKKCSLFRRGDPGDKPLGEYQADLDKRLAQHFREETTTDGKSTRAPYWVEAREKESPRLAIALQKRIRGKQTRSRRNLGDNIRSREMREITITGLDGKEYNVEANDITTIKQLKSLITQQYGIPTREIRLFKLPEGDDLEPEGEDGLSNNQLVPLAPTQLLLIRGMELKREIKIPISIPGYRHFRVLYQFCKNILNNSSSIYKTYLLFQKSVVKRRRPQFWDNSWFKQALDNKNSDMEAEFKKMVSHIFYNFYLKIDKGDWIVEGDNIQVLDRYLANPIDVNQSVFAFTRENDKYVIWRDLISVVASITPPPHDNNILIRTDYYDPVPWNKDMWCLYITFILYRSKSSRYKRLVDYDYSDFDKLYRYIYITYQNPEMLIGGDKITSPSFDFMLENIPEKYLYRRDDEDFDYESDSETDDYDDNLEPDYEIDDDSEIDEPIYDSEIDIYDSDEGMGYND